MLKAKFAVDFSPKCYLFCECNSVRVGQNIQNELSLERHIFAAHVVGYQFINFNWKLNGSREEFIPRSMWSYTTLAVRKGLSTITSKLYCMRNQMRFDGRRLCKASINIATRFSYISCTGTFQVRQTERLSSSHVLRIGGIRQHQLSRMRAITRNPGNLTLPFSSGEPCWMAHVTSRLFYFKVFISVVFAATSKGPMGVIAFHIPIRVDQFYCCQCATRSDNKTAF